MDAYDTLFGAALYKDYWIGLNDIATEGTLVWDKGETYEWANWESGNSNGETDDCVRVKSSDHGFKIKGCDSVSNSVQAALCMKGTSDRVATTAAPSGCTVSNVHEGKKYIFGKCNVHTSLQSQTFNTIDDCCTYCDGQVGMDIITWKRTGSKDECYCQDKSAHQNCDLASNAAPDYTAADCSCAKKRRKRSMMSNDTMSGLSILGDDVSSNEKSDQFESLTRHKRSIDTTKERKFTCESLWSGTGGYWDYDYTTPEHCFSKSTTSLYLLYYSSHLH